MQSIKEFFSNLRFGLFGAASMSLFFLVILSYFGYLSSIPDYLRASILVFVLLFWPGNILFRFFFLNSSEKIDCLQFIAYSFCFGVVFWSIIGFAYFYFNLKLDFIIIISLILSFFGSVLLNNFLKIKLIPEKSLFLNKRIFSLYFIFLYFLIVLFAFLTFFSAHYEKVEFDVFFHLAGIQKILTRETYLGSDFFLGGQATGLLPYMANGWYFILAIFSKISQVGPEKIYIVMSTIVSIVSVLVIYSLSRLILKEPKLAIISASLYIVYITIIYTRIIKPFFEVIYTAFLAHPGEALRFTIFPVLTIFLIKYIFSGKKAYLFSSLIFTVSIATIHIQYYLYLAITLISLLLISFFIKEKKYYVEEDN